ncbi:uncharacterized protein PGTG_11868 [Puccinia graminis f. sp. tritici CRL 75-36-700-3]|uniref:Uncharacterized protein n=1 Tax=Puccinia graminis f. sp. tritici (strain CRL 75-36-700-3 / race SCCL) TaxID=418459 RepID=E3KMI7_PUCGT|nr:uncharacterized protein PGTG_11868 [Puccinia graminis f. sp. tritici CRL 75-36-700-3]EFP85512.1 hypothetical protein PGTG_11868 [Puccinia graminis f. sp. tritici CRL 75-36-700-3]
MWYVVNKAVDSLFGVENCQENLRSGKYGIEVVINYLKNAYAGGVLTKDTPENLTSKIRNSTPGPVKKPLNAPKANLGPSKSTPQILKKSPQSTKPDPGIHNTNSKGTTAVFNQSRINDTKILSKCPNSTKTQVCDKCSISRHHDGSPQDLLFNCHCGAPPILFLKGQHQSAEVHWQSDG